METQSDALLSLLSDLAVWLEHSKEIDEDLVSRGVDRLTEYRAGHPGLFWDMLLKLQPIQLLDALARIEPAMKQDPIYDSGRGWPTPWNPTAIEYAERIQAGLKEKKENG